MIGETISHYKIVELLGSGGMGEVYKAEDLRLHRLVALKMMFSQPGQGQTGEQIRARFFKEARAASALSHPNIATIYEIDEIEHEGSRFSFIAMEYVPGRTLKEVGRDLTMAESLDAVAQIADALAEAHDRGIVHRDIKSSNIIVSDNNRVKILDFGVAKYNPVPHEDADTASLFHTDLMKTTPGTVVGTFAYMSPEQALGNEVDGRSDIFSLGVVSYELLAKKLPFTGSSALAVVDAILHADPLPVGMINFQVTPDLERIVHHMLEKNLSRRYQTMRELLTDLDVVRHSMPLVRDAYQTSQIFTSQLSSGAGLQSRMINTRLGKSIAVMSFNNITRNPEDDWIGTGIAETVAADLKKVEGLTIIGRERVYEVLRGWNVDQDHLVDETLATKVGREVGARWLVIGGYQRIADMLRITARFVDVETGEIIKTVKIDGGMKEIFDLQDKIVYELSRDLDLSLRSGELEGIEEKDTDVVEAYECCVKGTIAVYSGSREGIEESIALFEKAINLDPKYAQAYAGLGYAYVLKGQFLTTPEMFHKGAEYLQKAVELDPLLPDAYSGLGMAFIAMGRIDDAIGALRRALSFAPDDFQTHGALGRAYMIGKGLFREAIAEYEQALRHNPDAGWAAQQLSLCCAYIGDLERGEQAARQAISSQQKFISGQAGVQIIGSFLRLAHIHILLGRFDDAIAECYREIVFLRSSNHGLKDRTNIEANQKLVSACVGQGNLEDAREAYEKLLKDFDVRLAENKDDPFTRYYVACACAQMGDRDKAIEHLRIAVEGRREFNVARARVEIDFESLHNDPEFRKLIT